MSLHEPNDRAWTRADDMTELGGLSADERDQLADDLQREQQAVNDIGDLASALRRQMEVEQQRRYGTHPTATTASRSETPKRKHVTDGTPCWCEPTIEDYRAGTRPDGLRASTEADLDPDAVVPGIDASTGLSLYTPIVEPASEAVLLFGNRLRAWADEELGLGFLSSPQWHGLRSIADAIDRDAVDPRNATQRL